MRDLIQGEIRACLNLLTPRKVVGYAKIRVGGVRDGGYVMIDDLAPTGGIAYSIGVGPDTTWDVDMAERGWEVLQYDHTVEGAPNAHPACRFHRIGLGPDDTVPHLRRLDTLMRENGHAGSQRNILKMDIEGHEYACLSAMPLGFFSAFDQVVAELHWLDHLYDARSREAYRGLIANLASTHQCIHIHANNFATFQVTHGIAVPQVVEVTFVKRSLYDFAENDENSPGPLDTPNNETVPDLFLGLFRY